MDLFGSDCIAKPEPLTPLVPLDRKNYTPKSPYSEKLEIIKGDGVVTAGKYEVKRFTPIMSYRKKTEFQKSAPWEGFILSVLGFNHDIISKYPLPQDRYWIYTQELGCTPKTFVRMWNACNCKVFINQELKDVARKHCRGVKGWYDREKIHYLNKHSEAIKQLIKDGMENIVPLVLYYNKEAFNVKTFRKEVGKGTWKKLVKNSIHRNTLISSNNKNQLYRGLALEISDFIEYPSSLLPKGTSGVLVDKALIPLIKKERFLSNKEKVTKLHNIYNDILRMERRLPEVKRPRGHTKWDSSQYVEWHDTLVEKITSKDFSKDEIEWLKYYNLDKVLSDKYTVEILDSQFKIKMEGEAMKHCVGSYAKSVAEARYLVISLRNKEDKSRYSTLGLSFRDKGFSFSQHYKHCNASVDCEEAKTVAKQVLNSLQKQYTEITKRNK